MRTNIVIDDKLMRDTLRATGLKTKREAVEEGLRSLLRLKRQAEIRKFRGKLEWHGDLIEERPVILVDSSVWVDYFKRRITAD